mmetsp:Transcript_2826/g.8264  ORF Transcript_2826/g.8264 Transcript_2826/m.8264 type:complete len:353 (-) Transcript_2826:114-1172(-)
MIYSGSSGAPTVANIPSAIVVTEAPRSVSTFVAPPSPPSSAVASSPSSLSESDESGSRKSPKSSIRSSSPESLAPALASYSFSQRSFLQPSTKLSKRYVGRDSSISSRPGTFPAIALYASFADGNAAVSAHPSRAPSTTPVIVSLMAAPHVSSKNSASAGPSRPFSQSATASSRSMERIGSRNALMQPGSVATAMIASRKAWATSSTFSVIAPAMLPPTNGTPPTSSAAASNCSCPGTGIFRSSRAHVPTSCAAATMAFAAASRIFLKARVAMSWSSSIVRSAAATTSLATSSAASTTSSTASSQASAAFLACFLAFFLAFFICFRTPFFFLFFLPMVVPVVSCWATAGSAI